MKTKIILSFVILLSLLTIQTINSQWQQTALTTGSISSLAATQTHIFAGGSSVFSTSNNGTNWSNTGLTGTFKVSSNSTNVFAITVANEAKIYLSFDNGINWIMRNNLSSADGLSSLAVNGNNIFVGTIHYGMRQTTNNGDNWASFPNLYGSIYSIAATGDDIFIGRDNTSIYHSTNNGLNWAATVTPSRVLSLNVNGNTIYAGTDNNGVYISTDNGTTWSQSSLNNQTVKSIAVIGNNIFAGTSAGGVYFSNNSGASWVQKNEGLTNLSADALLINGNDIYLGTGGAGVWKRSLSDVLAIHNISSEVPNEYSLEQNYPNPFNPTTNIKFSLPVNGFTILNIYDAGGRLISALVNSELNAGTYEADFDGSGIASGIYFYTLASGDFTKTNKMILIK